MKKYPTALVFCTVCGVHSSHFPSQFASGSSYYLPLRKGEICKIDLERGTLTRSPVPKNDRGDAEAPGNLLFYNGDVVSQTETTVTCYPQVEFKVAQISALLKKNPTDPIALSQTLAQLSQYFQTDASTQYALSNSMMTQVAYCQDHLVP